MQPASNVNSGRDRSRAPVFVLGSPRSGTTLLYDMLLSAGGFAVYLAESNVFNLLVPRFGDLRVHANREKLLQAWEDSISGVVCAVRQQAGAREGNSGAN
jgi:hypothetical protein